MECCKGELFGGSRHSGHSSLRCSCIVICRRHNSRDQTRCNHDRASYPETPGRCPARESITRSRVTRDLSPQRVFDSSPVDCMASLPDLFKQKGGLESLRPSSWPDVSKEACPR